MTSKRTQIDYVHEDSILATSSNPKPLDCLGQANIIGLELVQAHSNSQSRCTQTPPKQGPGLWQSLRWYVVNDDGPRRVSKILSLYMMFHRLKTNMRVDDDCSTEDGISYGVEVPSCEWSDCQRHKNGGYQSAIAESAALGHDDRMELVPLKSPVVASMSGRRLGYGCWIIG